MIKYTIKFFGHIGVRTLEWEEYFMNDVWALKSVEHSMSHYYPVYQTAAVWKHDGEEHTLICKFAARVEIIRKES